MSRERDLEIAAQHLEFTRIPPKAVAWRTVLSLGRREDILKGGSPRIRNGEALYFLEKGEVRLIRTALDGREKIIWAVGAGSLFGETPFFDDLPAASTVVATENSTLYAFSRQCVLEQILPNHPDLMRALFRSLASKVRVLCNQSVTLSLDDLASRICKYLHLRFREQGEPSSLRINPGLNQQELASLLGVHRVTLNKALRKLEKAHILGPYARDEAYIIDMDRFHKLVFDGT